MLRIDGVKCVTGTDEQVDEFRQLLDNGHKDTLYAFGQDCACHGYKRGVRDCAIVFGITVACCWTYDVIKTYISNRKLNKSVKEFNEFMNSKIEEE